MATKDSIMKQSIFFWVFGHRLSFEYGLKKFLFGAWRNLSGALRELILTLKSVHLFFINLVLENFRILLEVLEMSLNFTQTCLYEP